MLRFKTIAKDFNGKGAIFEATTASHNYFIKRISLTDIKAGYSVYIDGELVVDGFNEKDSKNYCREIEG